MDKKKFKILMIVDIVLIIGIFALMMVLKGQYNDQAQKSVNEQVGAYLEQSNGVVQDQWKSVDQYGMAWRLVYATLRLLVVIAIIVAYMMMTGERGMRLLPFVGVMSAYFIVLDVLDATFLVKLQKELESA